MSKDKDPLVPWGYGGKIRLSQIPKDPMFLSLAEGFRDNILRMITENPSIGIGGADRELEQVASTFKDRYEEIQGPFNWLNPQIYKAAGKGRYKEYEGKNYRLKAGKAPSATPNASWHTGGYAVDFVGDTALAGKLADKYNLRQVLSTGEKWHFQPKGLPDGRRVIDFIKNRYGIDILKTPLNPKALDYINREFSSNSPQHPAGVLSMIDALIGVKPLGSGATPPASSKPNLPKKPKKSVKPVVPQDPYRSM